MTDPHLEEHEAQTTAEVEARILDAVDGIRKDWPDLLEIPKTGGNGGAPSTDTMTALDRRMLLREQVTRVLVKWARVIVDDRPLTHVHVGRDAARAAQAPKLLAIIDRHARWLSGHGDAGKAATQLGRLARSVHVAVDPPKRDHVTIGPCPFVIAIEGDEEAPDVARWECYGTVSSALGSGEATCSGCGQRGDVVWWEGVMGLTLPLCTLPQLVPMLHRRLGLRVTARTLQNWRRDRIIAPLYVVEPPFGIGPRLQWDLFDPQAVVEQVIAAKTACRLCGSPLDYIEDDEPVCFPCRWAAGDEPRRAVERPAYAVVNTGPRVVAAPSTRVPTRQAERAMAGPAHDRCTHPSCRQLRRRVLCDWWELPIDECACGRHNGRNLA